MNTRRLGLLGARCFSWASCCCAGCGGGPADPPTRRTSHKEAIEPPELVARYSRFMALLPMRLSARPTWRVNATCRFHAVARPGRGLRAGMVSA